MKDMMLGQMMSMLGSVLPAAEEPENPVAEFLSGEIQKLYPDNEIMSMIETSLIDIANNNPDTVLRALIVVYNDIGTFVELLQTETTNDD